MVKVSALVSAYFDHEFLDGRIVNLRAQMEDIQIVVVCQTNSKEYDTALKQGVDIVSTKSVPTIGAAWNMAIAASAGEYLTTANCDDVFYPGGLQTMANVLDCKPDAGLVFARCDKLKGGRVTEWRRYKSETDFVPGAFELLKSRCVIGSMPLWRSSLHEDFGMFDERLQVASDWDFWLYLAAAGIGFYYIDDPLGLYHWRENSLEHRNKKQLEAENMEIRLKCA